MLDTHVAAIVEALAQVPWLTRLGQPIDVAPLGAIRLAADPWTGDHDPWSSPLIEGELESAERLGSIDAWKGPEDAASEVIAEDVRTSYRALIDDAGWLSRRRRKAAYERVHARVVELAAPRVAYVPERDPWYAPNAAVWGASTIAGLMALYRLARVWPDTAIERQWQWYRRGHWPAAYNADAECFIVY